MVTVVPTATVVTAMPVSTIPWIVARAIIAVVGIRICGIISGINWRVITRAVITTSDADADGDMHACVSLGA